MSLRTALWAGLLLGAGWAEAALAAEGEIKGYMFGDYYYALSGPNEKQNGFQLRRIYFTYDLKWSDAVSGRFRLEANDAGFGKKERMTPYVKESSVIWKQEGGSVSAGLVPTPTWSISERVWGYRSIEKTILDLSKLGNAVDLGVQATRQMGDRARVLVMVGNGNGASTEADNDKKIYLQGYFKPGSFEAVLNADWQSQPGGKDQMTLAGFLGSSGAGLRAGVEGYYRIDKKAVGGEDQKGFGVSVFGSTPLGEETKVFARADLYEPNSDAEDDQQILLIGGLDWALDKELHVMPNLIFRIFQDADQDAELMPRITGFFEF